MYAKLVVGNSAISAQRAMRDIGRLLTSVTPSVSLLESYSQSSSVVVDNSFAGWTYVGSNYAADRPTIAVANSAVNLTSGVFPNYAFSAPCLDGSTKYAVLTTTHYTPTTEQTVTYGVLTSATSVSANGVCTNEGGRYYNGTGDGIAEELTTSIQLGVAGKIIHLIANARGITIIEENRGICAVWEMSSTDINLFYGTAPVIQYSHPDTSNLTATGIISPTLTTTTRTTSITHTCFGITNPNTGVYSGTIDPTIGLTTNIGFLARTVASGLQNGIDSTGLPKYNILPIIVSNDKYGYPTQYVTGVVPVYFCGSSIAASGDTVDINGETYYYFNTGSGYGLLMKLY